MDFWLAIVLIVLLGTGTGVISHFITESRKKSQVVERIKLEKEKLKIIDNAVLMGYTPEQVKGLKEMMSSDKLDTTLNQQQQIEQLSELLKQKDEQIAASQSQPVIVTAVPDQLPTTQVINVYSNDNSPVQTHRQYDYSPDVPYYAKESKPKPPPVQKAK